MTSRNPGCRGLPSRAAAALNFRARGRGALRININDSNASIRRINHANNHEGLLIKFDLLQYWQQRYGRLRGLTPEVVRSAMEELLLEGVPRRTVWMYFARLLSHLMEKTEGNDTIRAIELIMWEVQEEFPKRRPLWG